MYRSRDIYRGGWLDEDPKALKRACKLRQKILKDNHCPRCHCNLSPVYHTNKWYPENLGKLIFEGYGVTEEGECGRCGANVIEFAFEDVLAQAKEKAKSIIEKAKTASKVIKKHGKPVEMRQSNGDMLLCYRV